MSHVMKRFCVELIRNNALVERLEFDTLVDSAPPLQDK